jgi:hypothetical protein
MRKLLVCCAAVGSLLLGVGPAAAAQGTAEAARTASTAAPDFVLSSNYSSANFGPGILFPGETWDPHPWCHDCDSYGGPHYPDLIPGSGCYIDSNYLAITPQNGFDAPVTLSVSGLPAGVTARVPSTARIPAPGYPFIGTFMLEASSSVPLGKSFTATVTATSGSLVHTISLPVTVSNQVPAGCDNSPISWPALRYSEPSFPIDFIQNQVSADDIILGSPAPAGGTVVTFTSSDPPALSAPASVTIPAGQQGAPVTLTAHLVRKFTSVTITTSANGNSISSTFSVLPSSAETVTISEAQFDPSTGELLLFAKDQGDQAVAVLTVLDSSSHQVIGTMNYLGQGLFGAVLPVTKKPSTIRVVSSITGASASASVK